MHGILPNSTYVYAELELLGYLCATLRMVSIIGHHTKTIPCCFKNIDRVSHSKYSSLVTEKSTHSMGRESYRFVVGKSCVLVIIKYSGMSHSRSTDNGRLENESAIYVVGARVSEPHTSELNCDFSYYYYLAYVVPYIVDAVI